MFSVIIPVHNKLPHLDRSINSVLNQTFQDFELLLIDDASTDGSSEKIQEYKDSRIKTFRRDTPGPGGYAARNLGIKETKYDWIAFLDADDEWDKEYLQEKKKTIDKFPDVEIIATKWAWSRNNLIEKVPGFEKISAYYHNFTLIDYFYYNLMVWTSAVAIKKDLLIRAGLFPAGKCKRGGDMDTWIRCIYKSRGNIFINKTLSIYYRDTVNRVTDNDKNPSNTLCFLETVENIKEQTKDKKLLKAIDFYFSKFIYSFIIKNLRINKSINSYKLSLIDSKVLKVKILLKSYIYLILMKIKIK